MNHTVLGGLKKKVVPGWFCGHATRGICFVMDGRVTRSPPGHDFTTDRVAIRVGEVNF